MILPFKWVPATVSGHPLIGDRLMRLVYMDEAGTSEKEPVAVVAGIIVNADQEMRQVEEALAGLSAKYIPPEYRYSVAFHATDIFSGTGYFSRDRWPLPVRLNILREIAGLVPMFGLSVSIGFCMKDGALDNTQKHTLAYMSSILGIEQFMRDFSGTDEIAMVIAEDIPTARRHIKSAHHAFLDKELGPLAMLDTEFKKYLPIRHVKDTVHFAEKSQSSLLQIADTYAFIVRRYMAARKNETTAKHADTLMAYCGFPVELFDGRHRHGHRLFYLVPNQKAKNRSPIRLA